MGELQGLQDAKTAGKGFASFNREQQAQIVEDYFSASEERRAACRHWNRGRPASLRALCERGVDAERSWLSLALVGTFSQSRLCQLHRAWPEKRMA